MKRKLLDLVFIGASLHNHQLLNNEVSLSTCRDILRIRQQVGEVFFGNVEVFMW